MGGDPEKKSPSSRDLQRLLGTDGHTHFFEYMKYGDRIPPETITRAVNQLTKQGAVIDAATLVAKLTAPVLRKLTLVPAGPEFDTLLHRVATAIAAYERPASVLDHDGAVLREQARRAAKRKVRKQKMQVAATAYSGCAPTPPTLWSYDGQGTRLNVPGGKTGVP
jgi:hypothetical protein